MREGWELKKLGDVCDFVQGIQRGVKLQSITQKGTQVRFLRIVDYTQGNELPRYIDFPGDKYILNKDDIALVRYGASTGFVCKGLVGALANNLFRVIPKKDIELRNDFLFLFLTSSLFQNIVKQSMNGAAMPAISFSIIKDIPIYLIPLKEQKQIVSTLDKAFKQIDQAKANLEQNLHNAKELFQSKLNEVFSQRGEGWVEKSLKEITTKIGSGSTPRGGQATYKESGISLIRSMNVHDDGFREKKLAFIDDEQALKLKNVTLEKDDVLLNITGASVARCCIVPDEFLPARVNQHVSIIRLEKGILHPSYLHYCLTAQENKNKLLNIGRQGATREAITKVQIENFIVSYPKDMNKQLEVLEELNVIKVKSSLLQTHYQQKLNNLEELKKSILQKAFRGELT